MESRHEARLIPTSGLNGDEEKERRATSALLAVMSAVREFGRVLTQAVGAPAGRIETYIEVPHTLGERKLIPDGVIRVTRGQRCWTALVEVKTGANVLDGDQIDSYVELARHDGYDAVVTISNEIPAAVGEHPVRIDRRKSRNVGLHHWSWSYVLTQAVLQKEHRGVADPDQAWILGELIRYLEHSKSGALEFKDMGPAWVTVREAVVDGTLRPTDRSVGEVATRFDALLQHQCLLLGRHLGREVTSALPRRELADPAVRSQNLVTGLVGDGRLVGGIRIPNTVGPLVLTADLRAGQVSCHVDIDAPGQGRPTTQVNWLVRQLKQAPDGIRVEAFVAHARGPGAAELLSTVRAEPGRLVTEPSKNFRSFRVTMTTRMGSKRGGRGGFVESVTDVVKAFYGDVLQYLKAWSPSPPRLRELHPDELTRPAVASTDLSSQDGAEPVPKPAPDADAGTPAGSDQATGSEDDAGPVEQETVTAEAGAARG